MRQSNIVDQVPVEMPGIEKTSLIDMAQRGTLFAHGKAAMNAHIQDLIQLVNDFEGTDDHA